MLLRMPPVVRPIAAGPAMPLTLELPELDLPKPGDAGKTLAKLPEPPALDSAAQKRDWKITKEMLEQRTDAGDEWARTMDVGGTVAVWKQLAGATKAMDASVLQALVGAAMTAAGMQGGVGKRTWNRPRPFVQDPSIDVIGRKPKDASYPSIHSARAFAAARVIAELDPALGTSAYSLAREVAMSRIYAGVHFASDIVAGAQLGTQAGASVLKRWRAGKLKGIDAPSGSAKLVA